MAQLTAKETEQVERLVKRFVEKKHLVERFLNSVLLVFNGPELEPYIHSVRSRIKDDDHLRDKLHRKILKAKEGGTAFTITEDNLLTSIGDLAGIRILHLHTRQFEGIRDVLESLIDHERYKKVEGPFARTWDDESRKYFTDLGVETQDSPTLYTSVHYVIGSKSAEEVLCEIQVRTLMEEVWGEVDHQINYPHPTNNVSCAEQLMALARFTSGTSRLVDSIFRTHADSE